MRRLVPLVVLLAVCAGCATVPESSDVQVLRSLPGGPDTRSPAGPEPGVDPFRLVREFIEASGSPANDYAAAREYLTDGADSNWNASARLTVIEDDTQAVPEPGAAEGASRVRVTGTRIGSLGVDGSFTPGASTFSSTLNMVRERGEWRISDPPNGVFVEYTAFQQAYQAATVSFVDPNRGTLVPDVRWVPAQPFTSLPGRLLDLLLAGPSDALEGAVMTALPVGTRLRSNVLVDESGRSVVELTGLADLPERERRLIAAQIVGTLRTRVSATLALRADGEALVVGQPEWRSSDITPYTSPAAPRPDVPALAVYDGLLRDLNGAPVAGPAGSGEMTVLSAARSSPGGELLATVVGGPAGRPQLMAGRTGQELAPVPLDAATMTRPTWRAGTSDVWTVLDGTTVAGVAVTADGPSDPYTVDAAELTALGLGPITELRLSRDGVRVAAVVGGQAVVASVVLDEGQLRLSSPRVLRQANLLLASSLDWAAADRLMVASGGPRPEVSELSVDGLTLRRVRAVNLTSPLTSIVAAPGRELLVSDANGLWSYVDAQEEWEPVRTGIGPGALAFYPG